MYKYIYKYTHKQYMCVIFTYIHICMDLLGCDIKKEVTV